MSVLVPAVLMSLVVVFFVLQPLMTGREAPMERDDAELTDAQHRKRIALLALRDVEYDFHAGKLDEADYRSMKRQISTEALEALEEEEAEWRARSAVVAVGEEGIDPDRLGRVRDEAKGVEAEIAALRASLREGAICGQCGHPNPPGSRFCGDCGAALPKGQDPVGGS